MTEIGMWWYRPGKRTNFGDELGPHIIQRLGGTVRRVPVNQADLVACGSVLETVNAEGRDGTVVWGTGLMGFGTCSRPLDIRAVRGRLTAGAIGIDVPLGDPALLVPLLWDRVDRPIGRHRVGVIPHYVDRRRWPWADLVIDPTQHPDLVISQIGSCTAIASSSLHGLIVAQAFGIPTMRLYHPDVMGGAAPLGADWKWADYLTGCDRPIADVQQALLDALPEVTR